MTNRTFDSRGVEHDEQALERAWDAWVSKLEQDGLELVDDEPVDFEAYADGYVAHYETRAVVGVRA